MKIAKLARLELTEDEIALYQTRLGRVLDYIHELSALKTPDDAMVRHVPQDAIGLRDDVPQPFGHTDRLIANAPQSDDNHFLIPAVMED